jgi:hypothetical protein
MSQSTRAVALSAAAQATGPGSDADLVLSTAELFHTFLIQDDKPAAATAAPAAPVAAPKPPKAAKEAKEAKPPKATKLVPEEPETSTPGEEPEAETDAPDADAVKATIQKLLAAKQRDELVALLKKYKAASFSGLKEADYAAFTKEADEVLANAALGA